MENLTPFVVMYLVVLSLVFTVHTLRMGHDRGYWSPNRGIQLFYSAYTRFDQHGFLASTLAALSLAALVEIYPSGLAVLFILTFIGHFGFFTERVKMKPSPNKWRYTVALAWPFLYLIPAHALSQGREATLIVILALIMTMAGDFVWMRAGSRMKFEAWFSQRGARIFSVGFFVFAVAYLIRMWNRADLDLLYHLGVGAAITFVSLILFALAKRITLKYEDSYPLRRTVFLQVVVGALAASLMCSFDFAASQALTRSIHVVVVLILSIAVASYESEEEETRNIARGQAEYKEVPPPSKHSQTFVISLAATFLSYAFVVGAFVLFR